MNTDKTLLNKDNEERLSHLINILQHRSTSMQEFLDYSLTKTIELTGSRAGFIHQYSEEKQEFYAYTTPANFPYANQNGFSKKAYPLENAGFLAETVRQRKPIIVNNIKNMYQFEKTSPEGHEEFANFITIPIIKNDKIIGVVGLADKKTDYTTIDVLQSALLMEAVFNITETMKVEEALRQSEEKLKAVIETSPDGIAMTGLDGVITFITQRGSHMWGYASPYEMIGRSMMNFVEPSYHKKAIDKLKDVLQGEFNESTEFLMIRKDGSTFYSDVNASLLRDENGMPTEILYIQRDITERHRIQTEIKEMTLRDQLTGLFNRRKIDEMLNDIQHREKQLSVIIADIDLFKSVNDTYGHLTGDGVLIEISRRLESGIRKTDTLGRWGGEEFIIICPDTDLEGAVALAEKIRIKITEKPFSTAGAQTVSFGAAMLKKGESFDALLSRCDNALYHAKKAGRNRVSTEHDL